MARFSAPVKHTVTVRLADKDVDALDVIANELAKKSRLNVTWSDAVRYALDLASRELTRKR